MISQFQRVTTLYWCRYFTRNRAPSNALLSDTLLFYLGASNYYTLLYYLYPNGRISALDRQLERLHHQFSWYSENNFLLLKGNRWDFKKRLFHKRTSFCSRLQRCLQCTSPATCTSCVPVAIMHALFKSNNLGGLNMRWNTS